jgi:predicted phage baseplate assembly protein
VTIYGNVVKATQGETRSEVLGSGDGSKPFQQFTLRQPPLTFVAALTPSGAASTLEVRVNDLLWHEAGSLIELGPGQHGYLTRTDDDGRPPSIPMTDRRTGYRRRKSRRSTAADRQSGNVRKSQISIMLTPPCARRDQPAAGSRWGRPDNNQARRNIPKSVTALDRLVSVRDYADFASTFAGVGKASAAALSNGRQRVVQVTVAGIDDIPILPDSDLFQSLHAALLAYGDPHQPVRLAVRELLLLVLSAEVRLQPDYSWEKVKPILRDAVRKVLGFDQRELGQDVILSDVMAAMQAVRGVEYVDVQALAALDQDTIVQNLPDPKKDGENAKKNNLADRLGLKPHDRILVEMDRYMRKTGELLPAQIAYLTPDVPETLILNLREGRADD